MCVCTRVCIYVSVFLFVCFCLIKMYLKKMMYPLFEKRVNYKIPLNSISLRIVLLFSKLHSGSFGRNKQFSQHRSLPPCVCVCCRTPTRLREKPSLNPHRTTTPTPGLKYRAVKHREAGRRPGRQYQTGSYQPIVLPPYLLLKSYLQSTDNEV